MKSRKEVSKEEQDRHTLADTLREGKKGHGPDTKHDEDRLEHMAPQSGIGKNWPGREGGHR